MRTSQPYRLSIKLMENNDIAPVSPFFRPASCRSLLRQSCTVDSSYVPLPQPIGRVPDCEAPFYINIPDGGIPGAMNTNEISEPYHGIDVRDIRAETSTTFSLDKQGFELAVAEGTLGEAVLGAVTPDKLAKSEKILEAYAPAMEAFLKQRLKAERVFTFATRVEHSPSAPCCSTT